VKPQKITLVLLLRLLFAPAGWAVQSLGELGRKEAERRKTLDEQGVRGKVIETQDPSKLAPNGNVSVSKPEPGSRPPRLRANAAGSRSSSSIRNTIQKLDREIRGVEDRLSLVRQRAQSERWAPPPVGRISRSGSSAASEQRMRNEIQELELKLKRLQRERLEKYDAARRAGYLPGEIDGKGITP
jgi:hypothetical protein